MICFTHPDKPKYILHHKCLEAQKGSSPCLSFDVDSWPPLPEDTEHSLKRMDGKEISKIITIENSCIFFSNIDTTDAGIYSIYFLHNGKEVSALFELKVTSTQPVMRISNSKFENEGKAKSSLRCK